MWRVVLCLGVCLVSFGQERGPRGFMPSHMGPVVMGLPYSADLQNSRSQTLADGNTISRQTAGHVARDSSGRTYSTETIDGGPWGQTSPTTVTFISDPVAGYTFMLNARDKLAMRRAIKPKPDNSTAHMPHGPRGSERSETDLGTQIVNGINCTGKSVSRVIPAGQIGNAEAITEKGEIWTSTDLHIVVRSIHNDPRWGQFTYNLTNIQRAEPSAALFAVPADYTLKDAPSFGPRRTPPEF